jgi:hypothetical protein
MTGKTRPGGHVGRKFIAQFKALVLFIFCTVLLGKKNQLMSDTISEAVGTKSKSSLKDTATYHGFNLASSDFDVLPLSNSQFDSLLNEMGDVEIDNVLSPMPIPNTKHVQ